MTKNNDSFKVGRIMIVDDEAELMSALCETLTKHGYETQGFAAGADALKALAEQDYDLLLTDMMMPEMDGIALLKAGLEIDQNLVGIIMTGHGTIQTAVEAMKLGAFDYMLKPFKLAAVLPLLSRAMEVRHLRMENMQLHETVAIHELGKAIAFSSDLSDILSKVADAALQQCSADEASIMLPTQNGKELYVAVVRGGHGSYIGERLPLDQGVAGWVARNREPLVLKGGVNDQRFSPINPRADIRAAVSMPMLAGGNLVGVLNVNVTQAGHRHFTLGQVKALTVLVSIIAPILENSRLYIQVRQAEEKYRSIFESAHEGIFRSLPGGGFITANPALAQIFGYDSPEDILASVTDIARQIYANSDDAAEFARIMEIQKEVINFECQAHRKNGSRIWISVSAHAVRDEKGVQLYYEGTLEDITERKSSELRLKLAKEVLETLNRPNNVIKLVNDILHLVKESTGIEAAGIRLREGEDYPYYATNGFPNHFLEAENFLCTRDASDEIVRDSTGHPYLECRCGNVLRGRTDPSLPFFTEGGSFWTNSTAKHLAEKSEQECQGAIRSRCNEEGYESLALIPLRSGEEIIGLIQLSDMRQNLFTLDMIKFFEGIGAGIGIAVARKRSAEALRESEERFMNVFYSSLDAVLLIDGDRYFDCNKATVQMLGYSDRDNILMTHPSELSPPTQPDGSSSFEKSNEMTHTAFERGFHRFEWTHRRANGEAFPVEVSLTAIVLQGKNMLYCVWRDLTERKQAEEWLLRERSMVDRIMKTSPAGITVVNRKKQIVFANKRAEEILGLTKNEITRLTYESPALRITDYDGNPFPYEQLPIMQVLATGNPVYGVRHAIESSSGQRAFLLINGAPIHDEKGNISEVVLTIDDVTQFRQAEEKIEQSFNKLQKSLRDTIKAMSMIVETRDPYTSGHQEKVSRLAVAIANELHLSEEQIGGIQMAGSIHDIGKISVPAEILSKPGRLSDIEFRLIKVHPEAGYEILKDIEFSLPIAEIVIQHHERIDGSGYPKGLKGEEILIEARVIAVADVVDAIASHRPYRSALGLDMAMEEIEKNKGSIYDAAVADACLRLFREEGYQIERA